MTAATPSLSDMIAAAQQRQADRQARATAETEQDLLDKEQRFRAELTKLFGELPNLLGIAVDFDRWTKPIAFFNYQGHGYGIDQGVDFIWRLTRLDAYNGDRQIHKEITPLYGNEITSNQDVFLLNLVTLSELPSSPPMTTVELPEPTAEERLLNALREMIRSEACNVTF